MTGDETLTVGTHRVPGDRYQLEERIATGGMGEVWRATDTLLEREVAVKVLKREYADDPLFRSRFEAEARHAAALGHPNVASVLDFGELPDEDARGAVLPFLVMELVPGEPLSALLRKGEPMPPERAADLVAQAADAIGAAHAIGIVHRDVKPANLLVTPQGTVKITDFGIARAADGVALTQTGQLVGTPHYMSPEQAEGRPATQASDIYALGVVLYESLAGRRPFAGDTPVTTALAHLRDPVPPLPESVPAHLRAVVDKALAKDPADRFQTATELADALRGTPVDDSPPTLVGAPALDATQVLPTTRRATRSDHRRRRTLPAWLPWAAGAAGALLVILTLSLASGGDAGDPAAESPPPSPSTEGQAERTKRPKDNRVRVREGAFLGMDHDEAKDALESLGLEVDEEKMQPTSADQEQDTVAGVEPNGLVEPGATVTLLVWEEYKEPDPVDTNGKGPDHENPGKSKGKND